MKRARKYFYFGRMAWLEALRSGGRTFGRLFLYLLLIAAFRQLWLATAESHPLPFSVEQVIWYLVITEWIILSVPRSHQLQMEENARDGAIAYFLMRPVSFLSMKLAEGAGNTLLNLIINGLCGCAFAWLLTGQWLIAPAFLPVLVGMVTLAAMLELFFESAIGLSAFWLYESRAFFWVYQKLLFVFGGLMLPLDIYPEWMRQAAIYTPFYPMLYGPASLALHPSLAHALLCIGLLFFWIAVVWLALYLAFARCRSSLEISGG